MKSQETIYNKKPTGRRVLIIGNFDQAGKNPLNGQTLKTRELYELLKLDDSYRVDTWDTEFFNQRNVLKMFTLIGKLIKNKDYIILPARRSIKFLPLLTLFFAFFKRSRVVYVVIGGWLHEILEAHKWQIQVLNKLDAILIETNDMRLKCTQLGLNNVHILSNFKIIEPLQSKPLNQGVLKGVFISRIIEEKGVFLLLDAVELLNSNYQSQFKIDFYGPIQDSKEEFLKRVNQLENVNYKGFIEPQNIQNLLSQYHFFVFPTYYKGEGFPGALIDALFSHLPVVASDWKYNNEIVKDGVTGLIFKSKDSNDLADKMMRLITEPLLLDRFKENFPEYQNLYHYKQAQKTLNKYI